MRVRYFCTLYEGCITIPTLAPFTFVSLAFDLSVHRYPSSFFVCPTSHIDHCVPLAASASALSPHTPFAHLPPVRLDRLFARCERVNHLSRSDSHLFAPYAFHQLALAWFQNSTRT